MKVSTLIWILIFGVFSFLSFNRHSKSGYFNYHSEIWADKAGYYVYLPAAFKYDFDPAAFPKNIEEKTGRGFILDSVNKKVLTKYTYGVALIQLPWFLIADLAANILSLPDDGFSPVYHWSINFAGTTCFTLGLYFLYRYLLRRFSLPTIIVSLLFMIASTNLYYYAIDETGMSHIYSFMLFAAFMNFSDPRSAPVKSNPKYFILMAFLVGLITLIRPINLLFAAFVPFLYGTNSKKIITLSKELTISSIVSMMFALSVLFLPQLIYWKYSKGEFISYSYGSEGFLWLQPKVLHTLFSPNNGLFLYSPGMLIIMTSVIFLSLKGNSLAKIVLFLFFILTYVLSCWWDPSFGCSFGARSYVEYYVIFIVPFALFIETTIPHKRFRPFLYSICAITIIAAMKLTYTYDGCFYGKHDWDWQEYYSLITGPTK